MTTLSEARRLRVLFVRPTLSQGGADKVTVTVLKHLDRRRFEPHLALLKAEGVWMDQVPKDVGMHLLGVKRVRGMVPALTRLVRQLRPDVVFSTASGTNVAAITASRVSGYRPHVVVSERNILLNGGFRPKIVLQLFLKLMAYRFADRVTALSGGVADDLAGKLRLSRTAIEVLYNPLIDEALIAKSKELMDHPWLQPGNRTIVSAGRLVSWKGHPETIRAFAAVHADRPEARLIILGEGPELESLQALVASLGLQGQVEFGGFQKNPFRYFSRCAVFVLASHNEGLCNVLAEAMACGAPTVSTDCPHGPNEIITDGVDGFLVPVRDHERLVDRLLAILNDPALAQRLSEAGKRSAWRFSVDSIMRRYEGVIEESSVRI